MLKLRSVLLAASALAVGASTFCASNAQAAGTAVGRPSKMELSGNPVGPILERMPLTTTSIMPVGGAMAGAAAILGTPGNSAGPEFSPQAYGSAIERWPYSTARVANGSTQGGVGLANSPVTAKPYRQTGKLMMRFGTDWFMCTASLIKPGVVVTAAHCVHNYGQGSAGFANEVRWYPANTIEPLTSGGGVYGFYAGTQWRIPTVYLNGTDTCQSGAIGIVCNNDLATVVLAPKAGVLAGTTLGGTYTYGWNGYSFITSPAFGNAKVADITQLGYPKAFDLGYQMQRTNSFGKYIQGTGANGKILKNTQLGSAQTGGSSGGPWMVNFGTRPVTSASASLGTSSVSNAVIGVTSWGYTTVGVNVQGASFFGQNAEFPNADYGGRGAGNIGSIVNDTCVANPSAC
jgi:hypothetical protein